MTSKIFTLHHRPDPKIAIITEGAPSVVASPGHENTIRPPPDAIPDTRDTVIVPAQEEGFKRVFLGEHCWYAIRIGGGMLSRIKYIAAYQTNPISKITHYARVDRIEAYGDEGKYRLIFADPATPLPQPIPFADATTGSMQGPRYTSLAKLMAAKKVGDIFE